NFLSTEPNLPALPIQRIIRLSPACSTIVAWLCALSWLVLPGAATAQSMTPAQASQAAQSMPVLPDLVWALPPAPLGAHCAGRVICTELGTWGVHLRLTGSSLVRQDNSLPGGLLTPAASFTLGGWGEVGVHFPILLGPFGTDPLPLPPVVFAKG